MSRRTTGGFPAVVALAATLADDRLIGAACIGLAQMFDPRRKGEDDEGYAYRLTAAEKVCTRCRVRSACDVVAGELGRTAIGVWAGQVRNGERPRGRPRRRLRHESDPQHRGEWHRMRKKRPPFGRVVWRGTNRGRPVLRARCPHCADEHPFPKSPMVACPRTGLPLSLHLHTSPKRST